MLSLLATRLTSLLFLSLYFFDDELSNAESLLYTDWLFPSNFRLGSIDTVFGLCIKQVLSAGSFRRVCCLSWRKYSNNWQLSVCSLLLQFPSLSAYWLIELVIVESSESENSGLGAEDMLPIWEGVTVPWEFWGRCQKHHSSSSSIRFLTAISTTSKLG